MMKLDWCMQACSIPTMLSLEPGHMTQSQSLLAWHSIASGGEGVEHQLTDSLAALSKVICEVTIVGIADL